MAKRKERGGDPETPFLSDTNKSGQFDSVTPAGRLDGSVDKNPYDSGWRGWGLKDQSTDAARDTHPETPSLIGVAMTRATIKQGKR